jgi:hypothetical protein
MEGIVTVSLQDSEVEVVRMKSLATLARQDSDERALPLVHWAAATSAAVITATVASIIASLWAAAAFSSHNSGFYNHLDWWFGATAIGAAFVTAVLAGGMASARGVAAGVLNGLTSWAIIALVVGAAIVVALAAGGTTATLTLKSGSVAVGIIRPYVVFWAAIIGTGAAVLGGAAGGLIPRKRTSLVYLDSASSSTLVVTSAGPRSVDRVAS